MMWPYNDIPSTYDCEGYAWQTVVTPCQRCMLNDTRHCPVWCQIGRIKEGKEWH